MPFVVAEYAVTVFDPGVRGEPAVAHTDAHANAASGYAMPLEYALECDGANEAERAKEPALGGTAHRQRQRFRARRYRRRGEGRGSGRSGDAAGGSFGGQSGGRCRVGRMRNEPPRGAGPYPELCDQKRELRLEEVSPLAQTQPGQFPEMGSRDCCHLSVPHFAGRLGDWRRARL